MKIKFKVVKDIEVKTLLVKAGVRYWEDAIVNGVEDADGTLIPCRNGDYWCPKIDIETGKIINWVQGLKANVHYKVCDDGDYALLDDKGGIVIAKDGYVPKCLCPKEAGFGDYIIMDINENGEIEKWKFSLDGLAEKP